MQEAAMFDELHGPLSARAGARIGHYAGTLLIGSIVAVIAVGLFPPPGLLMFTVPLALFAFVLFSWAMMGQQDRRLCERCVLDKPLEPRFVVPYLVVLTARTSRPPRHRVGSAGPSSSPR